MNIITCIGHLPDTFNYKKISLKLRYFNLTGGVWRGGGEEGAKF